MYRKGEQEMAIAMNASTGKTRWEYAYNASFSGNLAMENGAGPHTTPLILGNRIYTVGILAILNCFDKTTGKLVWSKDLYKDFPGASRMDRGYSSSPMAYKSSIILTIGGAGHAVIALDPADGHLLWGKNDFGNSPSSPTLINVAGEDQLVAFLDDGGPAAHGLIAGLDPSNGALLWTHPHKTSWGLNISLPVWGDDGILVMSSAYGSGARAEDHSEGAVGEQPNAYSSHDDGAGGRGHLRVERFGPAPLTAIDIRTGEIKWQERAFPKASFVYADGKFFVVDEDRGVSLATLSPVGAKVISKFSLLAVCAGQEVDCGAGSRTLISTGNRLSPLVSPGKSAFCSFSKAAAATLTK